MSGPIRCLAIVNRGEAAMRCIRAVKALRAVEGSSLRVVALYTEADRDAPFLRHADQAIALSPKARPVDAYLDHEALIETLRRVGADAVWPGWGFVAEDPLFVERLRAEGIRFLGPGPEAMRTLGDKISSKELAERVGVPVIPWNGRALEDEEGPEAADDLGYPLAVKASAGGGGRGIRMVESPADLDAALRSARAEAQAAFGDGRLFLERKIAGGRHVEVQIVADTQGHVHAVGCRDCSVQRRHQKVLEEAPPPGLPDALRDQLLEAAKRIAEAVDYEGVGTVEFLLRDDAFFFLEMNPRLQVEHGITEATTGLDLVQLQIRIARGESLAGLEAQEEGVAIEARVCAEDPDQGFLPTPGRIVSYDAALGPRVRVDSGVSLGSEIPSAFDSLIAKVIATGHDREEALARLVCALEDFELVVEGGATNKGYLIDVLRSDAFQAGGVDTMWLDRFGEERTASRDYATEALVAAAILAYQRARHAARINFYADPSILSRDRVPPSRGTQLDLEYRGEAYKLEVYAIGSWRYRVHLEGRVVAATLREEGSRAGRLEIGQRALRLLFDPTESGIRVEIEGRPHRFGWQTAGQVRASTPAMVVSIDVEVGQEVRAGQALGLLEAMKMEIGFEAPVSGVVTGIQVQKGQQVAAGEVLLVIDPSGEAAVEAGGERLELIEPEDALSALFAADPDEGLGEPCLEAVDEAEPAARRDAIDAVREEVRRVFLGYDANPERAAKLAEFLECELPPKLSEGFRWQLAELRDELGCVADVNQLFIRAPRASVTGEVGPSNHARFRMFVRRLRAGGAGLHESFLELVRDALSHYGPQSLEPSDALERAVLRMISTQHETELRHRLLLGLLRRVTALARSGIHLGDDVALQEAVLRIAGTRGLVPNAVADAALEASYVIFERPSMEREAERTNKHLEGWLSEAESEPTAPPEEVLLHLAPAPRPVFDRVGRWLDDPDLRRRAIALAAHVRRRYAPLRPHSQESSRVDGEPVFRLDLDGRNTVLGRFAKARDVAGGIHALRETAKEQESRGAGEGFVMELFVPVHDADEAAQAEASVASALGGGLPAARFTLNLVRDDDVDLHPTWVPGPGGFVKDESLHDLHPETAARVDLARLRGFELERCEGSEGIYCFYGRSREEPGDQRIFVLADVRGHSPEDGQEADLYIPLFQRAYYDATRALRSLLSERDPKRRLQWNRVSLFVAAPVFLEPDVASRLSRRLAPAVRHLGIEKVVVRLRLLDRSLPEAPARPVEIVISDITGSNMEIDWRTPHTNPLSPHSDYERKVADARRRRLVYPYEIVRNLTGRGRPEGTSSRESNLPVGSFVEHDLDPEAAHPTAISVEGRPFGTNTSAVVFGTITTPAEKIPEGMTRVVILSDPTIGMGALTAAECDRIVAAIDLAEAMGVPVEWIPVSAGARIAMDSGTENLDATARVVRRIVTFTQAGGAIHVIVHGVNVGAQSYFDALSTMLMHTRGVLIMTPGASMVLTGRAALEASGAVSAEDEVAIGGYERVMGPNGQAQYFAEDLADAYRILYEHYRFTYVVPGESRVRERTSSDAIERDVGASQVETGDEDSGFSRVGEIFSDESNPGRKRAFPMRSVMSALVDTDDTHLERWHGWVGAETAIVWDAHLGGIPVSLIGIESQNVNREGYRPLDGPQSWSGGTLFPQSSKKVARALNAASGNRPAVVLANLSGFDGSPESMRKLQLEYGAEIARAVVNFEGPILFLVVSRYHGGAYVVFSQALNPQLKASALTGTYASVIGGGPAAAVVFAREVRGRASADPRVREVQEQLRFRRTPELREALEHAMQEATLEQQAAVAAEFDSIHTVERAREVGSLGSIVEPESMRAFLVQELRRELS